MKRNCDICGKEYTAKKADLKRGWGLTCNKRCAAEKREQSRQNYDKRTVRKNDIKRALWHNKKRKQYEQQEMKLRKNNPNWSDEEIWEKMFELTNEEAFLTKEARRSFLF